MAPRLLMKTTKCFLLAFGSPSSLGKYAFLRNGLLGGRHLCCLQNESEGLGTPM